MTDLNQSISFNIEDDSNDSNKNESVEQLLNYEDYSDKSFIVFGPATKTYKEELKILGGRFNGRLKSRDIFEGGPAWIFSSKVKDNVLGFLDKVNNGQWSTSQSLPSENDNTSELPQVIMPKYDSKYQLVKYKIFKPSEGMTVTIKAGDTVMEGTVVKVESHKDVIDTAYVSVSNRTSKLVICNGYWTVWGYNIKHTVRFQ